MKATTWEFRNRALVFGMIFAFTFPMYSVDRRNSTAAAADFLASQLRIDGGHVTRVLFGFAALLLVGAALIRTWSSAYLRAEVVYASDVKTESLVADGPYRWVRNPLYFANVLMAISLGAMMSRTGFFVAVVAMLMFCYRLILLEEYELRESRGEQYKIYQEAVPRLWPSLSPRIASAGGNADWIRGLKAESWYWGFVAALFAFAITLSLEVFFMTLGTSLVLLGAFSIILWKKAGSQSSSRPKD